MHEETLFIDFMENELCVASSILSNPVLANSVGCKFVPHILGSLDMDY